MPEERRRWRRFLDAVLAIGALPGETETRRSARHVVILGVIVGTLLSIPTSVSEIAAGYTWAGVPDLASVAFVPLLLWIVWRRPRWFNAGVTAFFIASFASGLVDTALFGGLFGSGLIPVFGLLYVIGALLVIGTRAALVWFAAFVASIVYAVAVPHWIDPIYHRSDRVTEAATNLVALGIVVVLVLAYFVRQRDRFQQRSDDLLHSILPGPIVERLKDEPGMIADDVPAATVLFADVVGFTPMSAGMTPAELVSLLNEVFATIDGFVEELGLEKIKTVGDETWSPPAFPPGRRITRSGRPRSRSGSKSTSRATRSAAGGSRSGSASTPAR